MELKTPLQGVPEAHACVACPSPDRTVIPVLHSGVGLWVREFSRILGLGLRSHLVHSSAFRAGGCLSRRIHSTTGLGDIFPSGMDSGLLSLRLVPVHGAWGSSGLGLAMDVMTVSLGFLGSLFLPG